MTFAGFVVRIGGTSICISRLHKSTCPYGMSNAHGLGTLGWLKLKTYCLGASWG